MSGKLITSRRRFIQSGAALLAAPAVARAAGTACAPYIGPVATGCALADSYAAQTGAPVIGTSYASNVCIPQVSAPSMTSSLSRTPCCIMDTPSTIQIAIPTWYVDSPQRPNSCSITNETNQPGSCYIAAAIEWTDGGALVPIFFQGSPTPPPQGGGINFVSDPIQNLASPGNKFWVWITQYNSAGIIYRDRSYGLGDASNGEAFITNVSNISNIVAGSGFAGGSRDYYFPWINNAGSASTHGTRIDQYTFRPIAILGRMTKPTVALVGDSRGAGLGDNYGDGSGFVGNMERSVGPTFAYLQLSRPGESASNFISSGSRRLQLASLCTHVIENLGGNDILGGYSFSILQKGKPLLWNQFGKPTSRIFNMTIDPVTGSSDFWTTLNGQSVYVDPHLPTFDFLSQFTQFNSFMRTASNLNGVGLIDTAAVVEPDWSGTEDFRWKVPQLTVNSFAQNGAEVVANVATTTGLNVGDYVAASAQGGGNGVYAIDVMNATQVSLAQSVFSGQWSGSGSLAASLCASGQRYTAVADGIHANPSGYQLIARSGTISPILFQL